MLSEAREFPLEHQFKYLTSIYLYSNFSKKFNLVTQSFIFSDSATTPEKKSYLLKTTPTFKLFILQR